jgi:hypothetical protein
MFFLRQYSGINSIIAVLIFNAVVFSSAYEVGVDYHSTGANFTDGVFITQYHIPTVRSSVLVQLQGMADRGANFLCLSIWLVAEPGHKTDLHWEATFPISDQETLNLHQYAEDVASIQSKIDGHRLHLDVAFGWLGAADYQMGNPIDGFGYSNLSAAEFTSRVNKTMDNVVQALSNVRHPDGTLLVQTIYLDGEIMIGAKKNQEWFLTTQYPRFVQIMANAGFSPAVYFIVDGMEAHILEADYIDALFPALNGHRSMYWVYRGLNFMKNQQLPFPARIDFSCYIDRENATYANLTSHVFNDASASLSVLGAPDLYGVAETYYFMDDTQRKDYGQAFAAEALSNPRLKRLSFWTTPDGGAKGIDIAYPFATEDYLIINF